MPQLLISTVGASLLANKTVRGCFDRSDVKCAVGELMKLTDPRNNRSFGAEINSIACLVDRDDFFDLRSLVFLVSDTETGKFVGEVLKEFFSILNPTGKTFRTSYRIVEKLNDANRFEFKHQGLRNFIKELAALVRGNTGGVAINATGGYKAQIAFATALGQAMKVPVYYRFESFDDIIELPPLPISLSPETLLNNTCVFVKLEIEENGLNWEEFKEMMGIRNYGDLDEIMKIFVDVEAIDGEILVFPSAMGQIYIESMWDNITYGDLVKCDFLTSKRSPDEKLTTSGKEPFSLRLIERHRSEIDEILKLKLVGMVIVEGSSKKYRRETYSVKAMGNHVEVKIYWGDGGLILKVFPAIGHVKIVEKLAEKIETILKQG